MSYTQTKLSLPLPLPLHLPIPLLRNRDRQTDRQTYSPSPLINKMKQTIVIKISMNGPKSRTKALKIAVGVAGVEKAEIQGQDKNQLAVTGDGIDSTELTMLIRKKVGHTELVSVTPIAEKKEEKKSEAAAAPPHTPIVWSTPYQFSVPSEYYHHREELHHPITNDNDSCTIM